MAAARRMHWLIALPIGLIVVTTLMFVQSAHRQRADAERTRALESQARAAALRSDSPSVQFRVGMLELAAKRPKPALAIFQRIGDAPPRLAGVAMAAHDMRNPTQSQLALHELQANHGDDAAYRIAQAYAWRGQSDEAFHWLDRAVVQRDGGLSEVKYDPALQTLRKDPRYGAVLDKLGLPR